MKSNFKFLSLTLGLIIVFQMSYAQFNPSINMSDNYYKKAPALKPVPMYPSLIFSFYPLAAIMGNFKVGMERKLSDLYSLKTNIRFGFGDKTSVYSYDVAYSNNSNISNYVMAMLEMQYRYYFADKAPNGYYGGIYGFYKMSNFNYETYNNYSYYNTTTSSYVYVNNSESHSKLLNGGGVGILIGNQYVTQQKIALDVYIGSGLSFSTTGGSNLRGLSGIADRYFNGIGFIVGANVGLALRK